MPATFTDENGRTILTVSFDPTPPDFPECLGSRGASCLCVRDEIYCDRQAADDMDRAAGYG